MISHPDSFSLLAELAMALAGFSGVAAAFSGRDRSYQSTEFIRLVSLFLTSGVVFAGSGAVYVLLLAEVAPPLVFRFVSLAAMLAYGGSRHSLDCQGVSCGRRAGLYQRKLGATPNLRTYISNRSVNGFKCYFGSTIHSFGSILVPINLWIMDVFKASHSCKLRVREVAL